MSSNILKKPKKQSAENYSEIEVCIDNSNDFVDSSYDITLEKDISVDDEKEDLKVPYVVMNDGNNEGSSDNFIVQISSNLSDALPGKSSSKGPRKRGRPKGHKAKHSKLNSTEDDFYPLTSGRRSESNTKLRFITAESANIYSKPRMIFTGKGIVKTIQPSSGVEVKRRRMSNKKSNFDKVSPSIDINKSIKTEEILLCDQYNENSSYEENLDELFEEVGEGSSKRKKKFKSCPSVDEVVECPICFKNLKTTSLNQHYKTHLGEKPHTCNLCEARFTRRGDVQRHKNFVHNTDKSFTCPKCPKVFLNKKLLKMHLMNHDKSIYFACDTCGFKFGKKEYYENHIKFIHPLPPGVLPKYSISENQNIDETSIQLENNDMFEYSTDNNDLHQNEDPLRSNDSSDVDKSIIKVENFELDESEDDSVHKVIGEKPVEKMLKYPHLKLCNGTLSLTQTIINSEDKDDELVNKAINAAVNQAATTLESMQSFAANTSQPQSNGVLEDDDEDLNDDEMENNLEKIMEENNEITSNNEVTYQNQESEIHINLSIGGQPKSYIIQAPAGSNINVQTQEGMEIVMNMVNHLCAGKTLDGPIEIVMHNEPSS